jgi:hypothetical protein
VIFRDLALEDRAWVPVGAAWKPAQYPLRLLLNSSTCWLKVVPTEMGSVGHLESLD